MADESKKDTDWIAGHEWVRLLKEHPELADKCVWARLEGRDWRDLLRVQPQFADKCDWMALDGWDMVNLLREQPQFADRCAWKNLSGGAWACLLEVQPQFADRCDWTKLEGKDWADLLRRQPQFADKCTKWDEFHALGWGALPKAGLSQAPSPFAKRYEEKISKILAGLVDAARPVEERYAELLALDKNHFVRDSRLPAACVMDIWSSDKVSESWKRKTLKRMMLRNSFHGVMFVPLDLEFDCPLNRDMLELMWDQKYDELEGAAFAEKLAEAERRDAGFWNAFLRQFLYTENYDEAYAPARWDFRRGVEFIERRCPGTVASFSDKFGNNALMYTFGALVESNSYYTLRTPYGIAMARDDMAVLEQLGCSPEAKNIFGISPAMMMRWTEGMMSQFGDNEDDCRGDVYGC